MRKPKAQGARFQFYESTPTDSGGTAYNVWMDQHGRIFEERAVPTYYPSGKRKGKDKTEFVPTVRCGVARH